MAPYLMSLILYLIISKVHILFHLSLAINIAMNTEHRGALKFHQAWNKVMRNPESRMWVFNWSKPTTEELVRGIDNGPILRKYLRNPPPKTHVHPFSNHEKQAIAEYIVCSCYKLADGTHLGFGLHPTPIHVSSRFIGPHDSAFHKNQVSVCRIVTGLCKERLFYFEFTWFVDGALLVRLEKWNSVGTRQLMRWSIVAFSPQNASVLVRQAMQPYGDFLNARFKSLLPCRTWCSVEVCDSRAAGMCMFCAIRGCPACMCPVSMRRRYAADTEGSVLLVKNALGVWKNLGKMLQTVPVVTSMVYNISKSKCDALTTSSNVVASGVLPLNISTTLKVTRHPCLQLHLDQSGVSDISTTLPLPLFEICSADGSYSERTPPPVSSECSPQESWSPVTPGDCEGFVNASIPCDIEQSVLMFDLW